MCLCLVDTLRPRWYGHFTDNIWTAPSHYLSQWWLVYWCIYASFSLHELTHWGRVMHICVSKLTIIGSGNGLSPDQRQAVICTNAGILLIGPLGTNFSEILIEILTSSFKKMRLKLLSAKRRPFRLGLNVLMISDVLLSWIIIFRSENNYIWISQQFAV